MKDIKVNELMQTKIFSVKAGDSVGKVNKIFHEHNFNILPVLEDGHLVGVVSKSDIIWLEDTFSQIKNHISKHVVIVDKNSSVQAAAHLMREFHIHHLVVIEEDEMIGIISSFDLLAALDTIDPLKPVLSLVLNFQDKAA